MAAMTMKRYFEYNKAVTLDPDNLEIRIKVAKTYTRKGFISKAFDELKRLKNEHPGYMPCSDSLGTVILWKWEHIIEAQAEWQKCSKSREPNHPEATMYMNLSRSATETTVISITLLMSIIRIRAYRVLVRQDCPHGLQRRSWAL
jgi:hypothetical protein